MRGIVFEFRADAEQACVHTRASKATPQILRYLSRNITVCAHSLSAQSTFLLARRQYSMNRPPATSPSSTMPVKTHCSCMFLVGRASQSSAGVVGVCVCVLGPGAVRMAGGGSAGGGGPGGSGGPGLSGGGGVALPRRNLTHSFFKLQQQGPRCPMANFERPLRNDIDCLSLQNGSVNACGSALCRALGRTCKS